MSSQPPPQEYEFTTINGKKMRRPKKPAGYAYRADEDWAEIPKEAVVNTSSHAYDTDEKYGKMTDDEINQLSPMMQQTARSRRKRYQNAQEQAKALGGK